MGTPEFINALGLVAGNQAGENGCPLCQICHDYLTETQFMECITDKNLCSKLDMVKIRMMDEILDRLARLENLALR